MANRGRSTDVRKNPQKPYKYAPRDIRPTSSENVILPAPKKTEKITTPVMMICNQGVLLAILFTDSNSLLLCL